MVRVFGGEAVAELPARVRDGTALAHDRHRSAGDASWQGKRLAARGVPHAEASKDVSITVVALEHGVGAVTERETVLGVAIYHDRCIVV